MVEVPQFATHYHLHGRQPFLNLSDLEPDHLGGVLAELDDLGRAGGSHRRFGPKYMQLRRETEALLRRRFIARGGRPVRRSPHYFVLGESAWFRSLYRDCAEVRIALADLPADATSVTWSDSVASMGLAAGYGVPTFPKPQYGKVFLLDEVAQMIDEYGLPDDAPPASYDGHQRQEFDHFIEVQLWRDEPIGRWRRSGVLGP